MKFPLAFPRCFPLCSKIPSLGSGYCRDDSNSSSSSLSLSLFPSFSWKWSWYFIYCPSKCYLFSAQASLCECYTGLAPLLPSLRSDFPFCHKFLHFPAHWESTGSLRFFGLIIWSCFVHLDIWPVWENAEKVEWAGAQSWQGLIQRAKNLETALLPSPPWANLELWAKCHKIAKYHFIKLPSASACV